MKLERKQKLTIVLGIGALFIVYGILDGLFKFNISKGTVNNVSMVLMIIAFSLLFSGRKFKKNGPNQTETNQTEINSSIPDTTAQIETSSNKQENDSENINDSDTITESDEKGKNVD